MAKGTITSMICDPSANGFSTQSDYLRDGGPHKLPLCVWGTGNQLSEFTLSSGNPVLVHTNVYANGTLFATYDTQKLHFYLNDWLGTRRVQTDSAGMVELTCSSLPFGDALSCTGSGADPTEQHFTGKERDTESGNDYFFARYYSSSTGRFLSPDWAAKVEPVPYAKMENPQSLNLYAYVENDPPTGLDPDGHQILGRSVGSCETNAAGNGCSTGQSDQYQQFASQKQAQQQGNSTGAQTDYASVSDYPTGAGGFHHTGIAVDSDDTHGFSTANPHTPWWKRLFGAPKARMEDDIDMHTNNAGEVARHNYIHIPITAEPAAAMRAAIADRTANPGRYNLLFNNCAQAVESILHAGGVSGIPHGEVNIPFVLHDVLLLERGSQ